MVDDHDRVLATASFSTTRQGYGRLLAWMRSHGDLRRVGVECTGSYGAGVLRFLQQAGIEVLEVTTPDRLDRRRKGSEADLPAFQWKDGLPNDDLDAQNAAHAAFAGIRTVTPRGRNGMVEALRVLKVCRKSAVAARRLALQMIHGMSISAPDALRDRLREMTRMQLIRTLAALRPDMSAYRDVEGACRIALRSLPRRYVELHDEIAELDERIGAIIEDLAPDLVARCGIGRESAASCYSLPEIIRIGSHRKPASPHSAVSVRSPHLPARRSGIV